MKPEAALHAINEILSPPPRMEQGLKVCGDAYWNLAGALIDLEQQILSAFATRRVQQQLKEVSNVLQAAGYK